MMIFTSDNAAGAAPEILAAVGQAAAGTAMPYGADPWTQRAEARIRDLFEAPEARVMLVTTGTAANALALACLCPPWGTVHAHEEAHVERDECGAPEFFTGGAKLTLVGGAGGRIDPEALSRSIRSVGDGVVHSVQNGALSLTQATERGEIYDPAQIARLAAIAHDHGMGVHLDGTRLANALARSGATPAQMSWRAGVDILCLGATKCGALGAEAVVLFDPARAWEFELRRKRAGHLLSKMRFVGAQIEAWLTDGLWLRLAAHANAMADRLADGIGRRPDARLLGAVQANMLFAEIGAPAHRRLESAGARYYPWPHVQPQGAGETGPIRIRLVCSHQTTAAEVDAFLAILAGD